MDKQNTEEFLNKIDLNSNIKEIDAYPDSRYVEYCAG